jgi:hypothetical protein
MPDKLELYQYQLVIKIPYEALDNLQARQIAQGYLDTTSLPKETVVKLQRVHDHKEPTGVPL